MASSEFRRQHSRVYWSSFHEDMAMSALGSPIPRSPAVAAAPAAGAAAPGSPTLQSPVQEQGLGQGSRDSSSSPSTSHKSQDSGFSDSDGSHRAAASPLSSSPEVTDAAQLPCTPSPTHTRLQLCLSGACTSTPRDRREAPATFGGHATPSDLRRRLSQDDSSIQSRPLPAIPAAYRRQRSAEETRRDAEQRRLQRASRALSRTSAALDTSLEDEADDDDAGQLNQTFPLAGPPDSGHRAPRSFIKNRKAAVTRRQQHPRFARTVSMYAATPGAAAAPLYAVADSEESCCSTPATPHHTTVLHVLQRSLPDGGEDTAAVTEAGVDAVADLPDDTIQRHLLLDTTAGPGVPAHTSTPKTAAVAAPSPKLMPPPAATPTRRPSGTSAATGPAGPRRGHERRASARPVNLLNNYDKDEAAAAAATRVQGPVGDITGAVSAWLGGLRLACEPECSVTLQSKALLGADPKGLRQLSGVQLASPQGLGHLQRRAHQLSCEYTKLCGRVQRGSLDQIGVQTEAFVNHVVAFLEDHVDAVPAASERAGRLRAACERLRGDATKPDPEPADMAASLAAVRAALTATVDAILEKQVQELVNVLEGPASPLSLRTAVSALCALGRQGSALSELVVRCGGVRALLQVVLDGRTSGTRRAALRALSAVCCTAKAVRALEQAGGVEVVAELLSEAGRAEEERAEAAAVLAQITAPWVPDNARVEGLSQHLDAIVHALTRLVRGASSGEVLLLAAAALSHLSYVETSAVWPLLTAGAAGAVLQAVRAQGARCSVFLQEQAATLIANMSAVPEARAELAAERAVVALLCFLQLRPSPLQRAADIAAAERVQHKAAIALSRLASDPVVASQVVSLEGVPRLVRLCRDEKERNHSDGVLVACLAALRKIAANCDSVVLSKRDHRELLEPRLLDSFMLFSTRQESYV